LQARKNYTAIEYWTIISYNTVEILETEHLQAVRIHVIMAV